MLLNYLKVSWRTITRRLGHSMINISGLAVGLACTLIIGTWIYQETSYDRHFDDADRIYRVGVNFYNIGDLAPGPPRFADEMRNGFSEVEHATRLRWAGEVNLVVNGDEFLEEAVFRADASFFDVFSYSFLRGESATALDEPDAIVLTQQLAGKLFGDDDPMGRVVLVGEDEEPHTVTGVVEDSGYRTHMPIQAWLPAEENTNNSWTSASPYNYVKLREGVSLQQYLASLDRLVEREIYPGFNTSQPYEEWKESDTGYRFIPIDIRDIYLKSEFRFELSATGNESNVKIFGAVALFILLLAAINFINIATARGAARAREVGIRKSLGTGRGGLIAQFLMESVVMSLVSMVLALGLAELFLTLFKNTTGLPFLESVLTQPLQLVWILGLATAVGLLAGIYPALYLSRFDPTHVLKGTFRSSSSSLFRNGLVVSQFTISIGLLICSGLVYQQVQYVQERDPGLDRENVLVVENAADLGSRREAFREEVASLGPVQAASYSNRIPAGTSISIDNLKTDEMAEATPVQTFRADDHFVPVMGFQLLSGRNFSVEIASDTSAIMLNQSAVRHLGLPDNPVGIRLSDGLEVIGVISDFNYESPRKPIEPTALMYRSGPGDRLAIKLADNASGSFTAELQGIWERYETGEAMSYYFLDRNYEQLLQNEKILAQVITLFTLLAIFISCLGLYGLSSYITEQRTKEIGIRRVLGAGVTDILLRLNRSFTTPVVIAIFISVPAAYLVMNRWLNNFAYKTGIDPLVFLLAAAGGLLIAWLTVSWQSLRAARANPVDSLRSE